MMKLAKESFNLLIMKNFMKLFKSFFYFVVLIYFCGCSSTKIDLNNIEENSLEYIEPYKLKPLDPLFIRFNGILDQSALEIVIDNSGYINLLHISQPLLASGLTTSELEEIIEKTYIDGEIYKNISVNVTVTAKAYYVQGEVNEPGQFELMPRTTLLQAIAKARGYSPFANKKKVTVARQGKIFTYNLASIEENPSQDIIIEAGDIIIVSKSLL